MSYTIQGLKFANTGFSPTADMRRTIENTMRARMGAFDIKSPYTTAYPDGHMDGPDTILTKQQEVTDSAIPIYTEHLSGFYHLNK